MNKKKRLAITAAAALVCFGLYVDNTRVDVETIPVHITDLPKEIDGIRIVQLSDLHLPHCAMPPDKLAALVDKQNPDMIVLTGDLIDRYSAFDSQGLDILTKKLTAIAPCYAVTGNHELLSGNIREWTAILSQNGVIILNNEWTELWHNGKPIALYGQTEDSQNLSPKTIENNTVSIMLSHHPENIDQFADTGCSLVLSGHAHGGEIRIFGQGLFSPGQGILPKYTSGLYRKKHTKMVVSRGLKSAAFPIRVFNAPHVPVLILRKSKY